MNKIANFVVITSNQNKLEEINKILGTKHQISTIEVPEIQSLDVDEVITAKAKAAYKKIKKPVLVTDVSLEIDALNGFPGTFVKFFVQRLGPAKIIEIIKGKQKTAKATESLGLYDGKNLTIFKASTYGTISPVPKGKSGFSFDIVFIPKGYNKTYAELAPAEKNRVSHRAKALKKLKEWLEADK